jgi:hypothetical protein
MTERTEQEYRDILEQHRLLLPYGKCSCGKWKSVEVMSFHDHRDHLAKILAEEDAAARL